MSVGPWQPLWLGEPEHQLYAALHRPAGADATRGVVLVPPLLHEQPRARRFLTEVASAFAAHGVAALRFDYFGSGDSAGHSEDLTLSTMHDDIGCACTALRSHSGASTVAVMAWRAGALVVWDWLHRGGVASELILWEPILDGRGWLNDLDRADAIERCSPSRYTGHCPTVAETSDGQLMGYAVTPALRDALAAVSITSTTAPSVPLWLLDRADALDGCARSLAPMRTRVLPDDAPRFGGGIRMDESLFMTSRMEQIANELALALAGGR